mgnify:CR=1 FL=1
MSQYFKIGKFVASYGLAGELLLVHTLGKKTALKGLKTLLLENSFLPYFIENAVAKNDEEILVKLEGIHSKETAKKITSKEVWLAENDFKKFVAKAAPISMLGFTLIDGKNNLGEITEVIEQPHQLLCSIMYKNNHAYIPVHEHNLIKVDNEAKKLYVTLPPGLLEIYE